MWGHVVSQAEAFGESVEDYCVVRADLSGYVSRQEVQQDSMTRFGCHDNGFFLVCIQTEEPPSPINKHRRLSSDVQETLH